MSFSMSQVNRKSVSKQDAVKRCYGLIYSNPILTDNVKLGMWKYAEYRFTQRNRGKFDKPQLEELIKELLEYCCGKSYLQISGKDVSINENQILYELKKAIYYGATRCLYDKTNTIIDTSKITFKENIQEPVRLSDDVKLEKQEVVDYFKELMI